MMLSKGISPWRIQHLHIYKPNTVPHGDKITFEREKKKGQDDYNADAGREQMIRIDRQ